MSVVQGRSRVQLLERLRRSHEYRQARRGCHSRNLVKNGLHHCRHQRVRCSHTVSFGLSISAFCTMQCKNTDAWDPSTEHQPHQWASVCIRAPLTKRPPTRACSRRNSWQYRGLHLQAGLKVGLPVAHCESCQCAESPFLTRTSSRTAIISRASNSKLFLCQLEKCPAPSMRRHIPGWQRWAAPCQQCLHMPLV